MCRIYACILKIKDTLSERAQLVFCVKNSRILKRAMIASPNKEIFCCFCDEVNIQHGDFYRLDA